MKDLSISTGHKRVPNSYVIVRARANELSERGAVAGLEGLLFAVLILVGGMVLIVNAWSVIDSRTALDAAAREFVRTYTDQSDPTSARSQGDRAARSVLAARGSQLANLEIAVDEPNGFGPCSLVSVHISAVVPALKAPFIDMFTSMKITATASELVDAHREMTADTSYDPEVTECFGP